MDNGSYPPTIGLILTGWGSVIDLTNPAAWCGRAISTRTWASTSHRTTRARSSPEVCPPSWLPGRLLGDDLLVTPVVERGARERTLVVSEGRWIDWFSGQEIIGPDRVTVDAPLSKLPLFVREGAIVPMLRPTVDSLAPATEPDRVDSYDTKPEVLYVLTARIPAAASSVLAVR